MAQLIGGAIGAYAGFLIGGPQGAQIGFALGSAAGGYLAAPDIEGPRLDDLKAPKVSYGAVIPYVEGHPPLPGVVVWSSDKREIANSTSAKGGPEATSFTYVIDVLYALAANDCGDLRRVWLNGELVWTNAEDASIESIAASAEAPWSAIALYKGGAEQLPNPVYEAAVGVGNAPAYRGRTTVFIQDLNLTGDQLPVLKFECGGPGEGALIGNSLALWIPYEGSTNDVIFPPAVKTYSVQPPDFDVNPNGDWHTFTQTQIPPSNTQSISYAASKLWEKETDYSEQANIRVSFKNVVLFNAGDQLPATCQFISFLNRFNGLESIGFGARYQTAMFAIPVVLHTDGNGGTEETDLDDFFVFNNNSETRHNFHIEIPPNPDSPSVSSSTVTTKIYWGMGDPDAEGYVKTLVVEHFQVGIPSRVVVGGGQRFKAGTESISNVQGVTSFDIKDVRLFFDGELRGDGIGLREPTLQEVVERQCEIAGIPAEYLDATDLATRFVSGMALTQITSPRNVIDTLSRGYFFSAVESDVLRFKFLGGEADETIPYEALGAALDTPSNDPLPIVLANDLEQPIQVYVKYINNSDDYQDGSEQSFRLTNSPGNSLALELPLVFRPIEAKAIADIVVQLGKATSQRFGPFSLTRDYAHLEPTDPVLLTDRDGNTYRARLTSKNEAQGVLTFEAVLDDAAIFNSQALTSTKYKNSTVVAPKVNTEFEPLDIPLLRDVDDLTGIYWAAGGSAGWPGAVWQQSADDTTFANISDTTRNTIIGVTDGTLADWVGGNFFDEVNVLRVNIPYGTLSSYTRDDVLNNGAGGYLVGNELIQARNATLVSTGVYDLTGLLRGRRGTEWAMVDHDADERFVVLTEDTLNRQPLNVSDIGSTIYWKAVTFGRLATTADSESLVFGSVSQRPFSPVDLRGSRSSGDLTLTWRRRPRLSTNFHAHLYPLGEASEAYQVVVYADNTYVVVKRVISTTAATAAYSSADQTTDFGSPQATVYVDIFQISATAGRGYALRGAI